MFSLKIVAACLLVYVTVSVSSTKYFLQSTYVQQACKTGENLMKIYTDHCKSIHGKKQCEVKIGGESFDDPKTRFDVVKMEKEEMNCFQFTDVSNKGTTYALKVVNATAIAIEEQPQGCRGTNGKDFLFQVFRHGFIRTIRHWKKCLAADCTGKVFLANNNGDFLVRRCFFDIIDINNLHPKPANAL